MKAIKKLFRKRSGQSNFFKQCPVTGGICMNPLCMFGCVEANHPGGEK